MKVADALNAQVESLNTEATALLAAGNGGGARRALLHAIALQRQRPAVERAGRVQRITLPAADGDDRHRLVAPVLGRAGSGADVMGRGPGRAAPA